MDTPYVIIGGDAAGMSAASKIMREQPRAHVIVFERSQTISYSACGMPYWISGVVESDRSLIVLTPEIARTKRGIDVRIHHEVIAIDPEKHIVHVVNQQTGDNLTQEYSKLCIATGARPLFLPIPGIDLEGVFPLRALTDAQQIEAHLRKKRVKTAVIIGAGYIGVEMVEALHTRSLTVHLVEAQSRLMSTFDKELTEPITTHLREKGIDIHLGTKIVAISRNMDILRVVTDSGTTIDAGIVIMAAGVRPNSELAHAAGLRLDESGAIHVDTHFRTSDKDIYAAGDCVVHHHLVLDRPVWIPLATSANKGGRITGENMIGGNARLPGILGTAIVKAFDYTMAMTGLSVDEARESGLWGAQGEYVGSATIETKDRAGYWPTAETITIKMVFDKRSGRILGCQMIGKDGVNKRIDIVATAITAKMTVNNIALLDLSYAPPYSTTHDPIQVCASVAQRELIPAEAH